MTVNSQETDAVLEELLDIVTVDGLKMPTFNVVLETFEKISQQKDYPAEQLGGAGALIVASIIYANRDNTPLIGLIKQRLKRYQSAIAQ